MRYESRELNERIDSLEKEIILKKVQSYYHDLEQSKASTSKSSSDNELDIENKHNDSLGNLDKQTNFLNPITKVRFQKWYVEITLKIKDFTLNHIAMMDTGADMNCIREGLIPTKYF